jgi:hypothetical protein
MILDTCAQQRTYERFFGLLGQRFCLLNKCGNLGVTSECYVYSKKRKWTSVFFK